MKINKFIVSTVLYFKSGNSKKVDWVEDKLVKKITNDTQEITEGLTIADADAHFQERFKEWKDKGTTIVRRNAKGDSSVIPFSEVEYATVSISTMDGNVLAEADMSSIGTEPIGPYIPPTPPQGPGPRTIEGHPAFTNKPHLIGGI